jgi:fructosamine-3-kinase
MTTFDHAVVAEAIAVQCGLRLARAPAGTVGGGSIHACYRWDHAGGPTGKEAGWLFVKLAALADRAMLEGEADGLTRLAATQAVRVPEVRALGVARETAFLAMTWIDRGRGSDVCERRLGERLAALHRCTAPRHGLDRDNHIGRTPQVNAWMDSWPAFFRERRLQPQLALAARNGLSRLEAPGQRLLDAVPALLTHAPPASLLHGDLWGGNWMADASDVPVVFDPAVYHGDRETDLAMTRLFGGFGPSFYEAYEHSWSLPAGNATRAQLYNLYHVLNHANLFGGGYVQQARAMMEQLLAQVRG